jgi:hypothetical protein
MDLIGFEDLYSFRERKKKGNLEDFFTELVGLMLQLSPKFRKYFFQFIKYKSKISNEIIPVTQETEESEDSDKKFDKPDLKIFFSEEEYENDNPKILCEHKIDHKIKSSQLRNYYITYSKKGCKEFRLITPKKPMYEDTSKFMFIQLYWNDLFNLLNKELYNNIFYKYDDYKELIKKQNLQFNTENKLIYQFLDFMDFCDLNVYDENYYSKEYGDFGSFCKKIMKSLEEYNSILSKLKKVLTGSKGSGLNKWVQDGIIYVSKGDTEYGIQVDNSKLWQYSYNYKTEKRDNSIINIKILNKIEVIKSNEIILDFFTIFENILMDISNEIKYKIKEKSIKITKNFKKNQLEVHYIINNEEHFFDLIFKKKKLLIDYDTHKKIIVDSYDFPSIYYKLKEFIESEIFTKN